MYHIIQNLLNPVSLLLLGAGLWLVIALMYCLVHMHSYPNCCHYNPEMLHHIDENGLNDTVIAHRKISHVANVLQRYIFASLGIFILIPISVSIGFVWIVGFVITTLLDTCCNCACIINNVFMASFDKKEQLEHVIKSPKCYDYDKQTIKKICVVGCGPSGLVTAKYMIDQGFDVTVYEKSNRIGGSFAHSYDGYLTSSNYLTQFSDLMIDAKDLIDTKGNESKSQRIKNGTFLSFQEYCNYLIRYATEFNIYDKIKFNTSVSKIIDTTRDNNDNIDNVNINTNRRWVVELTGREHCWKAFDHICVCTGIAGIPNIPKWVEKYKNNINLNNCDGQLQSVAHQCDIYHSSQFSGNIENHERIKNKNVLIIGCGESGSDLSYKISKLCQKCQKSSYMITRSKTSFGYLIPRFAGGFPSDMDTSRMYHTVRDLSLSFIIRFKRWLENFWLTPFDDISTLKYASTTQFNKGKSPFEYFGTKNLGVIKAVLYHRLKLISVDMYTGDHDEKAENHEIQIDEKVIKNIVDKHDINVIILCTGFNINVPFLDNLKSNFYNSGSSKQLDISKLYQNMFDINYKDSLIFVGFSRPMLGSLLPVSELAARYAALIISDKSPLVLPSEQEMLTIIDKQNQVRQKYFPLLYQKKRILVDFLKKSNDLAEVIGCKINLWQLFIKHPIMCYYSLTKPFQAIQYKMFINNKIDTDLDIKSVCEQMKLPPTIPWPVLLCEFLAFIFLQAKPTH